MIDAMGESTDPQPTVVVPVFNDWAALQMLATGVAAATAGGPRPRLVIVDDGSSEPGPDPERPGAHRPRGRDPAPPSQSRPSGAIAVGLCHAVVRGDSGTIAAMDGDGEDRPEDLPALLAAVGEEPQRIVVAERARRHAPLGFRLFYQLYSLVFRLLTGRHLGFGNYCALGPAAARRIVHMPEVTVHLAATLLSARLPILRLSMDRGPRYDGRSKMSFVALTGHGLRSIAVFGEAVLTRIVIAAFWLAALGALVLLIVFIMKLGGMASPGWTTTVAGVVIGVVVQTVVVSLLGLLLIMRGRRAETQDPEALAKAMIRRIDRFGPAA
jgi:hypothetical protein